MNFWADEPDTGIAARAPMVDAIFHISCRGLPADHADGLRLALCDILPWLNTEKSAAIIPVLGAASGNGWQRPRGEDSFIHLSRRAFFSLRLPQERVDEAKRLEGRKIRVGDAPLTVTRCKIRPLLPHATLLARHVALPEVDDETVFLSEVAQRLRRMGVIASKIMSGQRARIRVANERVPARGVLVAELTPTESLQLQTTGMGDKLTWGCGVFLPHKGIAPVGSVEGSALGSGASDAIAETPPPPRD